MQEGYKYNPEQLKSAEKILRLSVHLSEDKPKIIITRTNSSVVYIEKQEISGG